MLDILCLYLHYQLSFVIRSVHKPETNELTEVEGLFIFWGFCLLSFSKFENDGVIAFPNSRFHILFNKIRSSEHSKPTWLNLCGSWCFQEGLKTLNVTTAVLLLIPLHIFVTVLHQTGIITVTIYLVVVHFLASKAAIYRPSSNCSFVPTHFFHRPQRSQFSRFGVLGPEEFILTCNFLS